MAYEHVRVTPDQSFMVSQSRISEEATGTDLETAALREAEAEAELSQAFKVRILLTYGNRLDSALSKPHAVSESRYLSNWLTMRFSSGLRIDWWW